LAININSAKGLQEVMKSNLGPKGTIKMYKTVYAGFFVHVVGWYQEQVISS